MPVTAPALRASEVCPAVVRLFRSPAFGRRETLRASLWAAQTLRQPELRTEYGLNLKVKKIQNRFFGIDSDIMSEFKVDV
jgi:hypothetical protein